MNRSRLAPLAVAAALLLAPPAAEAAQLQAGAAKVDITDRHAAPVNDPLYAKALVLRSGEATAVIITSGFSEVGNKAGEREIQRGHW